MICSSHQYSSSNDEMQGGLGTSTAPPSDFTDISKAARRERLAGAHIPPRMASDKRWICWQPVKRDGKPTKLPVDVAPYHHKIDPTDDREWLECELALCGPSVLGGPCIGFVLGDGIGGVDLDSCRDPESGEIAPWAQEWIDEFDSYTEVSPSGTGVKIFAGGAPDGLPRNKVGLDPSEGMSDDKAPAVEAYTSGRYFTVTQQPLAESPAEVRDAPKAWEALIARLSEQGDHDTGEGEKPSLGGSEPTLPKEPPEPLDPKAVDKLRKAVPQAFDTPATESERDFALAFECAKRDWSPVEAWQLILAVRQDEKARRPDYIERTIRAAWRLRNKIMEEVADEYAMIYDGGKMLMHFRDEQHDGRTVWMPLKTKADFENHSDHPWAARKHYDQPGGRKYKGGFIFDPSDKASSDKLNLWQGWAVEPKPGDWSLIKRHVREVLANGNDEHADYILRWTAYMLQHPEQQAEAALVFQGPKGTGKGAWWQALKHITGQHGLQVSQPGQVTGRFNHHLRDCLALFVDEGFWAGAKDAEGQLKRMITEPTLTVEPKYVDAMEVPNHLHVMIASNEDWVIPATADERRFAVFAVSDARRQDEGYFAPLFEQIESDGPAAMLHDMLDMDLGDWHPRQDIPMTDALQRQVEHSEGAIPAALREILDAGSMPRDDEVPNMPADLVIKDRLRGFIKSRGHPDKTVTNKKIKDAVEGLGGTKAQPYLHGERPRCWRFPSLPEARQKFDPRATWDDREEWNPAAGSKLD